MAKQPWIRTLKPTTRQKTGLFPLPSLNFPHIFHSYCFSFKTLEEAAQLAEYLSSFYPSPYRQRIELGINELFLNAIEHGNLGIDYELKTQLKKINAWEKEIFKRLNEDGNKNKKVEVALEIYQDYILLKIKDEGEGFDWRLYNNNYPQTKRLHGRGLMMAQEICFDKVAFSEKGNEVSCLVYLSNLI